MLTRFFQPSRLFTGVFLALFFSIPSLFAQKITGTVTLPGGTPAEFATVILQQASDSAFIKGEVTDMDGKFELLAGESGKYLVNVSFIGYEEFRSAVIDVSGSDVELPAIGLTTGSTELATVEIVSRRQLIEVRPDMTVFNVSAGITNAGNNGLELLRKAPSVSIDNDDNISLRGRSGVVLYFDGKRSYLSTQELSNLLRGLNANDIESIEIITNPSAKYDAAGNAGIINIVTKKGKMLGTNGSVNISSAYQRLPKNNASVNLNHRTENFNIYGSAGVGYNEYYTWLNAEKMQDDRVFNQIFETTTTNAPVNAKLGLDFSKNPRHTFGFLANLNSNLGERGSDLFSETFISDGLEQPVDSILVSESHTNSTLLNGSANLNYRFADESGNTLNFDVDRGIFRTDAFTDQPNRYTNADGSVTLAQRDYATNSRAAIDIFTAKTDFEHSFKGTGASLGAGAKFARIISDNSFDFFNVVNEQNELDVAQSNQFRYTENVSAAYVSGILPLRKNLIWQAGLRWEGTHSIGDLERHLTQTPQPNDYVKRRYGNFFPSSSLTYNLSENHSFNLSYSRRIDRPIYENLNPFEWRIDEISFRKGSPFLRPEFSDNVEFRYTLNGSRTIGASYSVSKDNIVNIIEIDRDEPDKIFVNYRNLATRKYYAINASSPTNFKNWWTGYVNLTLHVNNYVADFEEFQFDLTSPVAVNLFVQQTFLLGKGWTYEVSGWYNSPTISNNGFRVVPMGSLDMGIQKKILKDQGTLKISYTDLFRTANWEGRNNAVSGLSVHTTTRRETQLVTLNFNYRFGKKTVKSARNRETGLEDERSRIGQ